MLLQTSRKARWRLVALTVLSPVLYVASFGPACWISSYCNAGGTFVVTIYKPIVFMIFRSTTWTTVPVARRMHDLARYCMVEYVWLGRRDGWDLRCTPTSLTEVAYSWEPDPDNSAANAAPAP